MKNHKTILASILAATLCAVSPGFASAADHGSSRNNSSSSDSRPAPAPAPEERSEPAPAPVDRSAPAPAQAPVERSAPAPAPVERSVPAPVERSAPAPVTNAPAQGSGTQPLPRPPGHGPVQPLPPYRARTPVRTAGNGNGQPAPSAPNTQQVSNQWQWNDDVSWIGTNAYWGDGFWGQLEAGLAASAYIVAHGSPGAQLLQAYGLTQTPCGPPNLVEILGPDASEICAFPNDHVAPGAYQVDVQTLTLISSPQ